MMSEALEAQVVDEPTGEVVIAEPTNLFGGSTPAQVLQRARETAEAFKPIVASHSVGIQGKQHITVEGWQTLGAMLGVTPVCTWTKQLANGWEARVEARTLDGRVIGAAEAECLRDEGRWKNADDYAVRSMAQTRATSKALASVLRFVATLAGASGTPAEEVPPEGFSEDRRAPSDKQLAFFERLLRERDVPGEQIALLRDWARNELTGGRGGSMSDAIDRLKSEGAQELVKAANAWATKNAAAEFTDTRDLPEDHGAAE